jgi:Zn ribbon nucleic-acid-binding protein
MKPWEDTSPCPKCEITATTPLMAEDKSRAMFCTACGYEWIEFDLDFVAKNWRALAAWEQHGEGEL